MARKSLLLRLEADVRHDVELAARRPASVTALPPAGVPVPGTR
jgi:hypothetical protein